MAKRLGIYDWSGKILDDYDNFNYCFDRDTVLPYDQNKIEKHFTWSWNGYYGYGNVNVDNGNFEIDNEFCKFSSMTVHSDCDKQPTKHVTEIYNEKGLYFLFSKMLYENK